MTDCVAWGQALGQRDNQEDAIRVEAPRGNCGEGDFLLVLADGMGGHAGGEVASNLAVRTFVDHFFNVSTNLRPRGRLGEALQVANEALAERIAEQSELRGMGCTLIGALVAEGRLVWVSVGDSLLFLVRGGQLKRLNADHSLFGELMEHVRRGEMSRAEAEAHPRRNALRSALTGTEIALTELEAMKIEDGDVVILASDGIETLQPNEIERIVRDRRDAGPEAVKIALLEAVEARGKPQQDNTSVVVMMTAHAPVSVITARETSSGLRRLVSSRLRMALAGGLAVAVLAGAILLGSWLSARDAPRPPAQPLGGQSGGGLTLPRSGGLGATPIEDGGPAQRQLPEGGSEVEDTEGTDGSVTEVPAEQQRPSEGAGGPIAEQPETDASAVQEAGPREEAEERPSAITPAEEADTTPDATPTGPDGEE